MHRSAVQSSGVLASAAAGAAARAGKGISAGCSGLLLHHERPSTAVRVVSCADGIRVLAAAVATTTLAVQGAQDLRRPLPATGSSQYRPCTPNKQRQGHKAGSAARQPCCSSVQSLAQTSSNKGHLPGIGNTPKSTTTTHNAHGHLDTTLVMQSGGQPGTVTQPRWLLAIWGSVWFSWLLLKGQCSGLVSSAHNSSHHPCSQR